MIMLDGNPANSGDYTPPARDNSPSNPTPAVKRTTAKQEEEISIEDLPF